MTATMLQCRQRNLAMMGAAACWPYYPFLPLRRDRADVEAPDLGILYDAWGVGKTPGYSASVFLVNILQVPPTEDALFLAPREVFDMVDEIFDAGWRVD
jgi:hypothetical protein